MNLPLSQLIPDSPTRAVLSKASLLHERPKMLLERVAIAAGQPDRVAHGDTAMFPRKFHNFQGELGQCSQHQLFALDFTIEAPDLFGERSQKVDLSLIHI